MKVLVLGGTGATGRLVIKELLSRDLDVITIVRTPDKLGSELLSSNKLTTIQDSITSLEIDDAIKYSNECDYIISCLGHNISFKGMFGRPHKLVTNATKLFCKAINRSGNSTKFILMNTTGNKNKGLIEKRSLGEKIVIGLIRILLPPHRDNECAAEYLRLGSKEHNNGIEWVAVRPDSLFNCDIVSEYEVYRSPVRSPIFNPGKTSRINVAHFMAELVVDEDLWKSWKGQMPVIYNKEI